ncbi:hypothetical protein BD779DRAFT_1469966 [Infundibulicybe gibba]|nr:hypothetical protein BD779DRAFT_1469966 [Infundibulicybe gibba]
MKFYICATLLLAGALQALAIPPPSTDVGSAITPRSPKGASGGGGRGGGRGRGGGIKTGNKGKNAKFNPSVRNELTCGTAGDAMLANSPPPSLHWADVSTSASDCDKLFNSKFSLEYKNTCSYKVGRDRVRAYRPACSGNSPALIVIGQGCIYTTHTDLPLAEVRKYGQDVLKCRSDKKGLVNGRTPMPGGFLCVADRRGCGDCL